MRCIHKNEWIRLSQIVIEWDHQLITRANG
ncbi:Uncharacterised protein [Vibrio cholerae]|nr:Uncharacterised protein [Vibrio cholerae]CSI86486.1 Uncharacterised protein [Vibrio cholerae]